MQKNWRDTIEAKIDIRILLGLSLKNSNNFFDYRPSPNFSFLWTWRFFGTRGFGLGPYNLREQNAKMMVEVFFFFVNYLLFFYIQKSACDVK